MQKNQKKKVSKKDIDNIVEKLYNTKGNLGVINPQSRFSPEEIERIKRRKFGRNLSEHYQNSYRERGPPTNIETVEKLHSFW